MEQYTKSEFTRHSTRVRSPLSQRRTKRLLRASVISAALLAGGIGLIVLALSG